MLTPVPELIEDLFLDKVIFNKYACPVGGCRKTFGLPVEIYQHLEVHVNFLLKYNLQSLGANNSNVSNARKNMLQV